MTHDSPGFFCIDGGAPRETVAALRAACTARDVTYFPLSPRATQPTGIKPLPAGSILFSASTTAASIRLEQWLWNDQVATIFDDGPHVDHVAPTPGFLVAGVPTPTALPLFSTDRNKLDAAAEVVGGLPCVLRFPGYSGGAGIVRVDTKPGLYSAVDHALARLSFPELVAFRPDAVNWRVVVVGDRAVGWTRGVIPTGDFRNRESDAPEDYGSDVPARLATVAIAAARSVRAKAAGVDLLETDAHGVEALEANAPFYFAHLQERGVDVAGALVDMLLADAARRAR